VSERLVSLLPLPPIWEHKIRSVSYENTHKICCVCVCAHRLHLLRCRDSLTENKLPKNIWSRKKNERIFFFIETRAHTTTCQERNASNFSVICQPFNKTRALCPHTPSSSHERQRWKEKERGKEDGGKREERSIRFVFFPVSNQSTHLTFSFLSRLWSFFSFS